VGLSGGVREIDSDLAVRDLRAVALNESFLRGRGEIPCKPVSDEADSLLENHTRIPSVPGTYIDKLLKYSTNRPSSTFGRFSV
jgi:hypothetical protein